MPQIEHKKKFAWRPILTTSGKWVWWRHYVKRTKVYWGLVRGYRGDAEFFTEGEWLLEEIKHSDRQRPPPPTFCKSVIK